MDMEGECCVEGSGKLWGWRRPDATLRSGAFYFSQQSHCWCLRRGSGGPF